MSGAFKNNDCSGCGGWSASNCSTFGIRSCSSIDLNSVISTRFDNFFSTWRYEISLELPFVESSVSLSSFIIQI